MANKKEIIKYVEIKLKEMKENIKRNNKIDKLPVDIVHEVADELGIFDIFRNNTNEYFNNSYKLKNVRLDYNLAKQRWTDVVIGDDVLNKQTKKMLEKIATERYDKICEENERVDKIAEGLDKKLEVFKTEMLLVGNVELVDYAKAFIESLDKGVVTDENI